MALKDNLRALRLQKGYTLQELARQIGVGKQTVQKYESGVIQNVPSDKIEKMAAFLGVTPEALMGWDAHSKAESEAAELLRKLHSGKCAGQKGIVMDFGGEGQELVTLSDEEYRAVQNMIEIIRKKHD